MGCVGEKKSKKEGEKSNLGQKRPLKETVETFGI
jgi:hypothetical protein